MATSYHGEAVAALRNLIHAMDNTNGFRLVSAKVNSSTSVIQVNVEENRQGLQLLHTIDISQIMPWKVLKTKSQTAKSIHITDFEYGQKVGDLEYPTRIVESIVRENGKEKAYICTTSISVKRPDIDLSSYTLSAFGLPEPTGYAHSNSGYMMYLYIAIPVFAAVGMLFAYVRRRYYPSAVALPPSGTAGS